MAEAIVPVDLFNPGQVLACLGLMETAEILIGGVAATFDWSSAQALFRLHADGDRDPVAEVLAFLARAEVVALAPAASANATEKWKVPTRRLAPDAPFPSPDPDSPATLPAELAEPRHDAAGAAPAPARRVVVDAWGDATRRDNAKFWAGSGGYPGAALLRDALDLVRDRLAGATADPFGLSSATTSGFRLDPRASYVPLNLGYSLNDHAAHVMRGFPLVEIFAVIGLANARPERGASKLDYRYGVITGGDRPLPPMFHRAALGAAPLPFPRRVFRMRLDWPGQENQARCITNVFEENAP